MISHHYISISVNQHATLTLGQPATVVDNESIRGIDGDRGWGIVMAGNLTWMLPNALRFRRDEGDDGGNYPQV